MPSVDIADEDRRDMVDIDQLYIHTIGAPNCSTNVSQQDHQFRRLLPFKTRADKFNTKSGPILCHPLLQSPMAQA